MAGNKIVLVSMPKSATVFVTKALEQSAGLTGYTISEPGPFPPEIEARALWHVRDTPNLMGTTHAPGVARNTRLLREAGIDRVVVLFRDPRDAMVSWWHHLERPDVRSWGWHLALMVAEGIVPPNYYELPRDAQIATLSENFLPRLVDFVHSWIRSSEIGILPIAYETFVTDPAASVRRILDLHDVEYDEVVLPAVNNDGNPENIDLGTHYRRGAAGSHRDELTPQEQERIAWAQLTVPAAAG